MREMSVNVEAFFQLVKLGIGTTTISPQIVDVDWDVVGTLARKHELLGVVLDGISEVRKYNDNANVNHKFNIPQTMLLQWIGEVMQSYEQRYVQYEKAIASLAGWYNQHGYKMMVLKGYACSLDWPNPEHRPCGDIDIWLFGKQKEADKNLVSSFRIQDPSFKIDSSHHHHTVFDWCGFSVENHYDFINVYDYKSSKEIETILKELGQDDSYFVEVGDASKGSATKVYLPSPDLHALFLLRHNVGHFASTYITLRHVLDWAFFVKAHTNEINWKWLIGVMETYHMKEFFNCINAICVEELGFPSELFHYVQFSPILKEKVLGDILHPKFTIEEPARLIPKLIYKYRRWYGNGWKQVLCYEDSRLSGFISNLWAHFLKPSSLWS